jgi:hypothetical protein
VKRLVAIVRALASLELRFPWRAGTPAPSSTRYVTAATFTFATYRGAMLAAPWAVRFWAHWHDVPGALGLSLRFQPLLRRAWMLSVWTSAASLDQFLDSPSHRLVMATFRPRLAGSRSVTWQTSAFDIDGCWQQARAALSPDFRAGQGLAAADPTASLNDENPPSRSRTASPS